MKFAETRMRRGNEACPEESVSLGPMQWMDGALRLTLESTFKLQDLSSQCSRDQEACDFEIVHSLHACVESRGRFMPSRHITTDSNCISVRNLNPPTPIRTPEFGIYEELKARKVRRRGTTRPQPISIPNPERNP